MKNPQEEPKQETQYLDEMPNVDKKLLAKMWEDTIPRVDPKRGVFLMNAHGVIDTREPKQETLNVKQNTHYVDFSNPNADKISSASTTSFKQATLEEAAEKYAKTAEGIDIPYQNGLYYGFVEGAKWQQEQIGKSEFLQKLRGTLSDAEARRLIFEQFKKK